jgi:hypothetical protein
MSFDNQVEIHEEMGDVAPEETVSQEGIVYKTNEKSQLNEMVQSHLAGIAQQEEAFTELEHVNATTPLTERIRGIVNNEKVRLVEMANTIEAPAEPALPENQSEE